MLFIFRASWFEVEKEEWKASTEPLPDKPAGFRRKSTLKIVTNDNGLHTVVLPKESVSIIEEVVENSKGETKQKTRRSTRRERWQSTKQRAEDRKNNINLQMENVGKISKEQLGRDVFALRPMRCNTFPTVTEDKFEVPKGRGMSMCNPRISSFVRLQENLRIEKSETDPENNQGGLRQINRTKEEGDVEKTENRDSEEKMTDCCVELEDVTVMKQEDETDSKQETRL